MSEALSQLKGIIGSGWPGLAESILARHAHELAVQQRNWDAEAAGFTDPQSAVYAVADLIDPEVSK